MEATPRFRVPFFFLFGGGGLVTTHGNPVGLSEEGRIGIATKHKPFTLPMTGTLSF